MSTIPLINQMALDDNGDPIPGGKLYFWETGSATPYDTYSDKARTTPNTNPVVADGDGRFGRIWLDPNQSYRVTFTDASDVQIWEEDDVDGVELSSSSTTARIKQIASNPVDYGAVGDGVADESTEVQSAIDNATGVVDLLGLTYRCDSQLTLGAGLTLRNGTLDFTNSTDNEYILTEGSRNLFKDLTSNASAGDESFDLTNVSGLSSGDWMLVKADDNFNGGSDDIGELVRIDSISTLTVNTVDPLFDDYTTANNAKAQKINMVSRVTVQDVTINCSVGASGNGKALVFQECEEVACRNVTINSPKGAGIELTGCAGGVIDGCTVYGASSTGIGFNVGGHSRNVRVSGSSSYLLATGFKIGEVDINDGVTRMCEVRGSAALGCTTGLLVDVNSEFNTLQAVVTKPAAGALYTDNGVATVVLGVQDLVSGNYDGIIGVGAGTGAGVVGTGGATGPGVKGDSSGGDGYGLLGQADTTSPVSSALRLVPQDTDPSTALTGDVYFNSASGQMRTCSAGTWSAVPQAPLVFSGNSDGNQSASLIYFQDGGTDIKSTLAAGAMNQLGRILRVKGLVTFSNYLGGRKVFLHLYLGGVDICEIAGPLGVDPNGTTVPVMFDLWLKTVTTGASGQIQGHRVLSYSGVTSWSSAATTPVPANTVDLTAATEFGLQGSTTGGMFAFLNHFTAEIL